MGPNGSGKSTLASVIAGKEEYEVEGGEIDFEGVDLLDLTPSTAEFSKSWGSGHGTSMFARVTATVFTNASTTTGLEEEWDKVAATATSTIEDIETGDYILVKTGQADVSFDIFIIKVTAVEETPSDNFDYIEFSYKGG